MFVKLKKAFQGQALGSCIQLSDTDAQALIDGGLADKIDDPLAPLIEKSMEGLLANVSTAMSRSIDAALQQFTDAAGRSRRNAQPLLFGAKGEGDPQRTFGRFLLAVRSADRKALEEMGSGFVEWGETERKAAMSTQTGTQGGYLVPTQHFNHLMALAIEMSIVRPRATIIPMSARSVQVPALDMTTVPVAGDTAFLGGLVARWTEEATTKTETEPTFKQVEIINYELSGFSKVSNALLADNAVGLEAFLFQLFARAIAWYEDHAFLRGNGVGKPLGVIPWAGFLAATRSGASAFTLDDYADVLSRWLPNYNPRSSCWVCHPTVLAKLFQMVSTASGHTVFLPGGAGTMVGSATARPLMQLSGLPLEVSEKVPALNTLGDIFVADWAHYLIGDRQQVEIAFSEHAGFTTNQTFWRFVSRIGGQPWLKTFITLADGASTISPFVGLAAGA